MRRLSKSLSGVLIGLAACQTNPAAWAAAPTVESPAPRELECRTHAGTQTTLRALVDDADGDQLRVDWAVNGTVMETDTVPAGTTPPPAEVAFTHTFPLGAHTVRVTVTDATGVSDFCETTVTVRDTTPPEVLCRLRQTLLWPPNHKLVNVGLQVRVRDACDPNPTVQFAVFSDESEDATGDGNTSPDAVEIGAGTLQLRAERSGNGDGRVHLILITATDESGNIGHDCCVVVVPHDLSRRSVQSAQLQGRVAEAFCDRNEGAIPAGFFVLGSDAPLPPPDDDGDDENGDDRDKDKDKDKNKDKDKDKGRGNGNGPPPGHGNGNGNGNGHGRSR